MISPSEEFLETFGPDAVFSGCDFRPHFDGYLWNGARLIEPEETREIHMALAWSYVQEMAMWILARRAQFHAGDRFQLIIGWPTSVRPSARQIIKIGGDFDELTRIASAETYSAYESMAIRDVFRPSWDKGIFT